MPEFTRESRIQEAIEKVRGVLSCRVVLGPAEELSEVHILARRTRSAKQIVRDVEAVCLASFNLTVDHKRVSVAQIDDEPEEAVGAITRLFPRAVSASSAGSELEIRVELFSEDGGSFVGVASGPQSGVNRLRLVAMATLLAVEDYLRGLCSFVLDDVADFDIGRFKGVLVGITLITAQGEEGLVGAALMRRDAGDSVVKAVLSAVNRRVNMIAGAQAS